jgi:SMC interacting uncharacterized protein involved in chromosome segregation
MIRPVVFAALLAGAALMPASALSQNDLERCQAMAATLAPKQAEITQLKEKRDTAAAKLAEMRAEWEEAETMRNFDADAAQRADALDADYETLERTVANSERALQALVQQFNQDVAAYNSSCSTD